MQFEPANSNSMSVTMVVGNDCVADSRVIKAAEAVSDLGHTVRIVCLQSEREPNNTLINGIEFIRVPLRDRSFKMFLERRPVLRFFYFALKLPLVAYWYIKAGFRQLNRVRRIGNSKFYRWRVRRERSFRRSLKLTSHGIRTTRKKWARSIKLARPSRRRKRRVKIATPAGPVYAHKKRSSLFYALDDFWFDLRNRKRTRRKVKVADIDKQVREPKKRSALYYVLDDFWYDFSQEVSPIFKPIFMGIRRVFSIVFLTAIPTLLLLLVSPLLLLARSLKRTAPEADEEENPAQDIRKRIRSGSNVWTFFKLKGREKAPTADLLDVNEVELETPRLTFRQRRRVWSKRFSRRLQRLRKVSSNKFKQVFIRKPKRFFKILRSKISRFYRIQIRRRLVLTKAAIRRFYVLRRAAYTRWRKRVISPHMRKLKVNFLGYSNFEAFTLSTLDALKEGSPDIIHAHDLITLPAAAEAAKAVGAKLIYDSHELELHRNATYTDFVKSARARFERRAIKQCASVITVCDSISDHLKEVYPIAKPVVIMNSPQFDAYEAAERNLKQDIGVSPDTPVAVYVGSVTINRGIEFMPHALVHAPGVHLAHVGPQRKQTVELAMAAAREAGVEDRVHFLDPVPANQVVNYIKDATMSLLPIQNVCLSYYYCFPNKLLESMFANLPVVVSNLYELEKFVHHFGCGEVVDETSTESIGKAIAKVAASPHLYKPSEEALETLLRDYSWDSQRSRLQTLYGSILGQKPIPQELHTPPPHMVAS